MTDSADSNATNTKKKLPWYAMVTIFFGVITPLTIGVFIATGIIGWITMPHAEIPEGQPIRYEATHRIITNPPYRLSDQVWISTNKRDHKTIDRVHTRRCAETWREADPTRTKHQHLPRVLGIRPTFATYHRPGPITPNVSLPTVGKSTPRPYRDQPGKRHRNHDRGPPNPRSPQIVRHRFHHPGNRPGIFHHCTHLFRCNHPRYVRRAGPSQRSMLNQAPLIEQRVNHSFRPAVAGSNVAHDARFCNIDNPV